MNIPLIFLLLFLHFTEGIWLLESIGRISNLTAVDPALICASAPTAKVRRLCEGSPENVRAISLTINEAIVECQKQFAHDRWDCAARSGVHDVHLKLQSKERALILALVSSSAAQSVSKLCARGRDPNCGCGKLPNRPLNESFVWAGCSDNVKIGNRIAHKLLDIPNADKPEESLLDQHNSRAGRKLLSRTVQPKCKCHGVSGSCTVRTCFKVTPEVPDLVGELRRKYKRAARVRIEPNATALVLEAEGTNRTDGSPRPQRSLAAVRSITPAVFQLVFTTKSPDACAPDPSTGNPLSVGRECSSPAECRRLCCERGFVRIREAFRENCHCRFVYCCRVECDECVKDVERFYCK